MKQRIWFRVGGVLLPVLLGVAAGYVVVGLSQPSRAKGESAQANVSAAAPGAREADLGEVRRRILEMERRLSDMDDSVRVFGTRYSEGVPFEQSAEMPRKEAGTAFEDEEGSSSSEDDAWYGAVELFDNESRDRGWAEAAEGSIREELQGYVGLPPEVVSSVECRSERCMVEFDWSGLAEAADRRESLLFAIPSLNCTRHFRQEDTEGASLIYDCSEGNRGDSEV